MQDLSRDEQQFLLNTARNAIAEDLGLDYSDKLTTDLSVFIQKHSVLKELCGAFVTLKYGEQLRGCIGNMVGRHPLFKTVSMMAVSSAFKDPRFPPLARCEFDQIRIEISVLSPLTRIDDPRSIIPGFHGLYITQGLYSGVLLPQVATEQNWGVEEFIAHTCRKAGLSADALKNPSTSYDTFTVQKFSESASA